MRKAIITIVVTINLLSTAVAASATDKGTLPPLSQMQVFREKLATCIKSQTLADAESYYGAIDDYVAEALDLGWSIDQVNAQLETLQSLDPTMPDPSYDLSRVLADDRVIYFAEYRVSSWAGSTIRIFERSEGHFRLTFNFTPLAYKSSDIEEYVSIESTIWTGKEVVILARCIGSMSGYAPAGSLFLWTYDPKTKLATERLRLLHKDGLSVRPLSRWNLDVTVEYRPVVDGEVDRARSYRETYKNISGKYELVQRECIRICK